MLKLSAGLNIRRCAVCDPKKNGRGIEALIALPRLGYEAAMTTDDSQYSQLATIIKKERESIL